MTLLRKRPLQGGPDQTACACNQYLHKAIVTTDSCDFAQIYLFRPLRSIRCFSYFLRSRMTKSTSILISRSVSILRNGTMPLPPLAM